MTFRRITVVVLGGTLGFSSILTAQHIRINNAGVIPNGGMTPPTILKSTIARYTNEAQSRNVEGTVTLEALVDADGNIKISRTLKGLGFGLDEAARLAVADWTVSPATRNGSPVSVVAHIDVAFNLRSANAIRVGPGITPPMPIHRVEPKYTDEARRQGLNGTVVLQAVIKTDGTIDILSVVRGMPLGLTENAIQALKQWQFRPGNKDGKDVDILVNNIEINFELNRK
jgi:TonB family protein